MGMKGVKRNLLSFTSEVSTYMVYTSSTRIVHVLLHIRLVTQKGLA